MTNAKVTRIAAYAVCIDEGRILLARWVGVEGKLWTLPGGGVEHGEDPHDTAVREVAEETGYDIAIDRLLGVHTYNATYPRRSGEVVDYHHLRVIYAAHVVGGKLRFEVGGSTDQAAWFALSEVESLEKVAAVDVGIALHAEKPVTGRLG